jgi:hypothetical protein
MWAVAVLVICICIIVDGSYVLRFGPLHQVSAWQQHLKTRDHRLLINRKKVNKINDLQSVTIANKESSDDC